MGLELGNWVFTLIVLIREFPDTTKVMYYNIYFETTENTPFHT